MTAPLSFFESTKLEDNILDLLLEITQDNYSDEDQIVKIINLFCNVAELPVEKLTQYFLECDESGTILLLAGLNYETALQEVYELLAEDSSLIPTQAVLQHIQKVYEKYLAIPTESLDDADGVIEGTIRSLEWLAKLMLLIIDENTLFPEPILQTLLNSPSEDLRKVGIETLSDLRRYTEIIRFVHDDMVRIQQYAIVHLMYDQTLFTLENQKIMQAIIDNPERENQVKITAQEWFDLYQKLGA